MAYLSMYSALAEYENDKSGFDIADLKKLTGPLWDQGLWDDLAESTFDLSLQDQSPKMPYFDKTIGKWVYLP